MNVEEIRLQTFSNWPEDAPVEAHRIARSGFFATGNGLELQCHWCGLKISEWDYGDQVRVILLLKMLLILIKNLNFDACYSKQCWESIVV